MSLRSFASALLEVLAIIVVTSLIIGSLLGQPILLSYVETGSMEPTLNTGDGFVAVPSLFAGDAQEGDVVVFEAKELHGGGLTTHRVVGETENGYVTKGDANPFTDQDGGEPPVTDDQIVAHALQIGGTVVRIPYIGVGIEGIQGFVGSLQSMALAVPVLGSLIAGQGVGTILIGVGGLLFVATMFLEEGTRGHVRKRSRERDAMIDTRLATVLLLAAILIPANGTMLLGSGTQQLEIDGAEVQAVDGIEPGETASWDVAVENYGFVPLVLILDADSAGDVASERITLGPGESETVSVTGEAPEPGERTVIDLAESRYLLVLPPAVVEGLHEFHPLVAVVSINVVLASGFLLAMNRFVGIGVFRIRNGANVALGTRIRRRFG